MTVSREEKAGVTRRSVTRSAAWAVPAVALGSTAPQASASDPCASAPPRPARVEHPGPRNTTRPNYCPPKGYPFQNWQRRHCDRLAREDAEHTKKEEAYRKYVNEHDAWNKKYGHCAPAPNTPGRQCDVSAIKSPRPGYVAAPTYVGAAGPKPNRPSGCPDGARHGAACTEWRNRVDAWDKDVKARAKYLVQQDDWNQFAREDAAWLAQNPNCEKQPYGPGKPPRPVIIAAPKRQGFNRSMKGTSDGDRSYFQVFPTVEPWFDLQINKDSDDRKLLSKWDKDKSTGMILPVWGKPTGQGTRIKVTLRELSAEVHYNDHAITGGPFKGWNPPTLEVYDHYYFDVDAPGPYWRDDNHLIGYESEERYPGKSWPRKTWRWDLTLKRNIASISDGDNPGANDWSGVEFAIAYRRIGVLSPKPDYEIRVESEWGVMYTYVS